MRSSPATRPTFVLEILLGAALYFAIARMGLSLATASASVSEVWPASGVALAMLVLRGLRLWPAILAGAFAANYSIDVPAGAALGIATGNMLEALIAAMLLSRAGFDPALKRLRDVAALFILAAGVSTIVSATLGVLTLCATGLEPWQRFGRLWWVWWSGDAVGDLLVAPAILTWAQQARRRWQLERLSEGIAVTAMLLILSSVVFLGADGTTSWPVHYLIFPIIIWAALRLGQHATSAIVLAAAVVTNAATLVGFGPFVLPTLESSLLHIELFMSVVAVTGLFLGAAMAERNRAEHQRNEDYARLRQSEERLALALAAGQMGAWEWDIETNVVQWSRTVETLHGIRPGTFARTFDAFRELIHPDDVARVMTAIRKATDETGQYEIEFRHLRGDGSVHWVATRARVVHVDGKPKRMVGVVMDVTERKRIDEALTQQAAQLEEADRRKDEFLAVLGHELRNPLAPLQNALELLGRRPDDARILEQARTLMARQLRHLVRLVDDLLDVSRIRSGKITLTKTRVALAMLVESAVELSKPVIDAKRHRLSISIPPEPMWLDADPTRVPQLLANLLNNAARYTPEDGSISLVATLENDEAVVRVRDTGIGMTPAAIEHVFELFAQGDGSHAVQGGLGVGLSLARSLAELHGGLLEAHSDGPGHGSEFVLRLPLARRVPLRESATSDNAHTSGTRRVLVVDDNVDAADSLGLILGHGGHDVRVAHGGREALEIVTSFVPDVMILDLGMPDMDGYELAREIRTVERLCNVRLIALSGYGQAEDRQQTAAAGFDAHLIKPVEYGALERAIAAGSGSSVAASA